MDYNFDTIIPRKGTGSVKWDLVDSLYQGEDLLPMWVADMDFRSPEPVLAAVAKVAEHGIFGYPLAMPAYYEAIVSWMRKRHGWSIQKDWIVYSPGIVPALNMLLDTYTQPGDAVLVQQPVYYPFMKAIEQHECQTINNPLRLEKGTYQVDFDDFQKKITENQVKIFILCSPHNPVGRVWNREELTRMGELCREHEVLVVSDEIHSDLIYKGHTHIPFASLSEEFLQQSITCTSPSKTFNLAGLYTSNLVIANPELRKTYKQTLKKNGIEGPSAFGAAALQAAYQEGEAWLEQLMKYIEANYQFLKDYLLKEIPGVNVIEPEGTYLVWMDFRAYIESAREMQDFMRHKAKVALSEGSIFGAGCEGFARINIACPRALLEQGLAQIRDACRTL